MSRSGSGPNDPRQGSSLSDWARDQRPARGRGGSGGREGEPPRRGNPPPARASAPRRGADRPGADRPGAGRHSAPRQWADVAPWDEGRRRSDDVGWSRAEAQGWDERADGDRWGESAAVAAPGRKQAASTRKKKRGKDAARPKIPLKRRIGSWMTADAWRWSVLRRWPSALRLFVVAVLLGSCGGLGLFAMRGQIGGSGLSIGAEGLIQPSVGPGTPTPNLYLSDPFTPLPVPTTPPTPTKTAAQTTPTAGAATFQVTLTPQIGQCATVATVLPPVTLTLDNSQGTAAVSWTLTLSNSSDGQPWATETGASAGTLPAGSKPQAVTLKPAADLCLLVQQQGGQEQFTATVTATPGGAIPETYAVTSGTGVAPTPSTTPASTVTPTPSKATPTPTPTP